MLSCARTVSEYGDVVNNVPIYSFHLHSSFHLSFLCACVRACMRACVPVQVALE